MVLKSEDGVGEWRSSTDVTFTKLIFHKQHALVYLYWVCVFECDIWNTLKILLTFTIQRLPPIEIDINVFFPYNVYFFLRCIYLGLVTQTSLISINKLILCSCFYMYLTLRIIIIFVGCYGEWVWYSNAAWQQYSLMWAVHHLFFVVYAVLNYSSWRMKGLWFWREMNVFYCSMILLCANISVNMLSVIWAVKKSLCVFAVQCLTTGFVLTLSPACLPV